MTRRFARLLLAWMGGLLISAGVLAQDFQAVPQLQRRVTDLAGMLTPNQREALENQLQQYEAEKGSQIAVLLINSTAPETIEQYSIRVVDAWKLGRKGVDDGVLLLVAKDNPASLNRLRIETGRGTEGVLTDLRSKQILEDIIAPYFRQNDFYGGLTAGTAAIMAALNNETFDPPARQQEAEVAAGSWLSLFILLIFFFIIMRSRNRSSLLTGMILGGALGRGGRGGQGGGFGGGGFGGGGGGFGGGGASGNW